MSNKLTTRNYEDVVEAIADVSKHLDDKFENKTVAELKDMYDAVDTLLNEWDHLSTDVVRMFDILEENNLI